MVELQAHLDTLARHDIWACAISYDSVEVLAGFAKRFDIRYPLLSDPDSAIIRRFGILNTYIPPEHPWHGIPFPGTYMVDSAGRVVARSFYANHAKRDAIARMVQDDLQLDDAPKSTAQTFAADPVLVHAWLSSETIHPGQVVTLQVDIALQDGYHIYGAPLPAGYVPTRLVVEPLEGVQVGEVAYPAPQPYEFAALGEVLPAYEGHVTLKAPIFCQRRDDFVLRTHLQYQACNDRECLLPQQLNLELPVRCRPNVR